MPFLLADIGEGITEVQIVQWFVKNGDKVAQFQKIAEVQSDKAAVEITSKYDGVVVKTYYKENETAKVGKPLCDIDTFDSLDEESVKTKNDSKNLDQTGGQTEKAKETSNAMLMIDNDPNLGILATPAIRRIAKENSIDLSKIKGTGKDGRIMKEDVLMLASNTISEEIKPQKTTQLPIDRTLPVETKPLNGVQKAMIKSMTNALKVPHFGYYDEFCLDQLKSIKKELVDILDEPSTKLSFMPFFIKAASVALKEFPIMNASLDLENNQVIYHHYHNIGVAIDSPQGLVVPNIKNVQDKSVVEIAKDLNKLIEAAKQNQLKPADFANGTFTLSNVGTVGGTYTSPILVLPEVVIGALGKAQTLPRFDESGKVYPSLIAKISWSADHRIIDGASLARFSNKWKSYIENPKRMILGF